MHLEYWRIGNVRMRENVINDGVSWPVKRGSGFNCVLLLLRRSEACDMLLY